MAGASLYRRLLGARFDQLPPVLRSFHDDPGGHQARGVFEVERGAGWLAAGLGRALKMPPSGPAVPVELRVQVTGDRERWTRSFDGRTLETIQWARDGLLMESLGPWIFASELLADKSGLRFHFRRAWFGPIALPLALGPRIDGEAIARVEGGWAVGVRIRAPIAGPVLSYRGWVVPE